jgi:hypothetical protein
LKRQRLEKRCNKVMPVVGCRSPEHILTEELHHTTSKQAKKECIRYPTHTHTNERTEGVSPESRDDEGDRIATELSRGKQP